MKNIKFLSEYMKEYKDNYVLIGGNACALNFELIGAEFRATEDLDIVLLIDGQNESFYEHLSNFLIEHDYKGKFLKGDKVSGSAYRFIRPNSAAADLPAQIELFSKKPEYFDEDKSKKLHITPIETQDGISNFSAILLDDHVYNFILESKIEVNDISTVKVECLLGLKSIAWHANQILLSEGKSKEIDVVKHPEDMLRISSIIEASDFYFPEMVFNSLTESYEEFGKGDILLRIGNPSLSVTDYLSYYSSHAKLAS